MRRALVGALLLCGLLAPAARAGAPFTVGEGQDPHLHVDGDGSAHVVWHEDHDLIHYCRVPRGASACAARQALTAGLERGSDATFVLPGAPGTLHWLMPHHLDAKTYLWRSADGGATWSERTQIYSHGGGTHATEPVPGPQAGQVSLATFNPTSHAYAAALDGGEAAFDSTAQLSGGGGYDLQLARTTDGGLVAVANDLEDASFFFMAGGREPSDDAAWSAASPIGPGRDTRVAGGPSGAYVLARVGAGTRSPHMEIRRWQGTAFGPPFSIPEDGHAGDLHVGPSGAVAAVFRVDGGPDQLRLALSVDGGGSFALRTIALHDAAMDGMDVALAPDDGGFAVYEGAGGSTGAKAQIVVVSTDPVPTADAAASPQSASGPSPAASSPRPAAIRRVVRDVRGAQLMLDVPGACLPAGTRRFTARLSLRRLPRRGTFVSVRRVDFLLGTRRVGRDRRAPFVQTIRIPAPVAGRTYRVRARVYVKRSRQRRLQRKTLPARIAVCGG